MAIDGHQVNVRDPHIYRTRDYGASFEKITDGIPPSMLSYTKVIVGGHAAPGAALCRNRERDLRLLQRRRRLAAAPEQPAARAGVGDRRAGSTSATWSSAPTAAASGSWTTSRRSSSSPRKRWRRPPTLFAPRDAYRFRPITPAFGPLQRPHRGDGPRIRPRRSTTGWRTRPTKPRRSRS